MQQQTGKMLIMHAPFCVNHVYRGRQKLCRLLMAQRIRGDWVAMQIECLLPASKVSFTKFGERYCLMQNNFARGKSFYGSKYDGAHSFLGSTQSKITDSDAPSAQPLHLE